MTIRIIRSIIVKRTIVTFREVKKLLVSNGWYHDHTNGSHYIYKSNNKDVRIIVPRHKEDIPRRSAFEKNL